MAQSRQWIQVLRNQYSWCNSGHSLQMQIFWVLVKLHTYNEVLFKICVADHPIQDDHNIDGY